METNFPVNYTIKDLSYTPLKLRDLWDALASNLQATVDEGIIGARSIANPATEESPWLDAGTWKVWDDTSKAYTPAGVIVGSVQLSAEPTANRLQTIQDKDGTIALLDDAYGIRETVILPDGAVGVDWDSGTNFLCRIKRKTYFHMQHSRSGMRRRLWVVNSGTNNTLLWDAAIKWPTGGAPAMPAAPAGGAASLMVTLYNINDIIYAEYQTQTGIGVGDSPGAGT
jgi:hypothetical protein